MRRILFPCAAIIALLPVFIAVMSCGSHGKNAGNHKLAVATKKTVIYQCPMHPQITSEKPGTCPICGMDLVPVEMTSTNSPSPALADRTEISISSEKQQLIGVTKDAVKKVALTRTVRTYGLIAHDTELYSAQQEYISALKYYRDSKAQSNSLTVAKSLLDSAGIRLRLLGMKEAEISELSARNTSDSSLILPGSSAMGWIEAEVYENDLPFVRAGQPVRISSPSDPAHAASGVVRTVEIMVNQDTRTAKCRISFTHAKDALLHGSFVNIEILVPLGTRLAVPYSAVIDTGLRQIVYVERKPGVFEPRDVRLGAEADGYYEVLWGLQESETVVTSGNFLMDSESSIRSVQQEAMHGK